MTTALTMFGTRTLIEMQRLIAPPDTYWMQFFPNQYLFETEEIVFDEVTSLRLMAAFTAPGVVSRVSADTGFATKIFRPAYMKPKNEINPGKLVNRRAGEALNGNLSMDQRLRIQLGDHLAEQKEKIVRRWNWMAASAVVNGTVVVAGEDYPTQTVDFGRHASLTADLSGGSRWDQPTATPLADITTMRTLVNTRGRSTITRLTMGLGAWDYFRAFDDVRDLLSTQKRGSDSNFNASALGSGEEVEFRGVLSVTGSGTPLEIYTYHGGYDDPDGTAHDILDTNTVVGTGPGIAGVKCFGAIKHMRALYAVPMFPYVWDEDGDPSGTFTMTSSAPLMVPARPNGSFSLHVT
jgi:Phage major capsid protein E